MPQHGEIDNKKNLIYCGYWMTFDDWDDIHKYSPNVDGSNYDAKETLEDIE
ncbi:hypothetical protein BH23THE1_BH23THE1_07010 [soil metagenome]